MQTKYKTVTIFIEWLMRRRSTWQNHMMKIKWIWITFWSHWRLNDRRKQLLKKYKITIRIYVFLLITSLLFLSGVCIDTQAKSNNKKNDQSGQSTECPYKNKEKIYLDKNWKYADHAKITSGYAVFYKAKKNRKIKRQSKM